MQIAATLIYQHAQNDFLPLRILIRLFMRNSIKTFVAVANRVDASVILCERVQIMQKIRGRPRKFNDDHVLRRAASLFQRQGYTATSLDELSEITGLARPSLYNAFGDMLSLYRKALAFSLSEIHALARSELRNFARSEEHTSELQSLMRISY